MHKKCSINAIPNPHVVLHSCSSSLPPPVQTHIQCPPPHLHKQSYPAFKAHGEIALYPTPNSQSSLSPVNLTELIASTIHFILNHLLPSIVLSLLVHSDLWQQGWVFIFSKPSSAPSSVANIVGTQQTLGECCPRYCCFIFLPPHGLLPARLSVYGISQQEYWSGLPFPPPGDLPNPEIESPSPALAVKMDSLPLSHEGKSVVPIDKS